MARILSLQNAFVEMLVFGKIQETKNDARTNFEVIQKLDGQTGVYQYEINSRDEWDKFLYGNYQDWDVVVDAIFGTGLNRPIDIWLGNVVHHINIVNEKSNHVPRICVSIDVPSGLNSDLSEQIGENFQADLTVTFTAPKLANVFPPALNFNGELRVANIGSPQELIDNCPSKLYLAEKSDAQKWLEKTKVKTDSYKKTRGTCLIIAGSQDFSGAAVLAANACFAAGAGMVSLAVPNSIKSIVASKTSDEIIVKTLEDIKISDEKVDVIALGCGLSNDEDTRKFIRKTVENRIAPMVLDAEALNALAPFDLQGSDEFPLVLTPHIGEFRRLLGREFSEDKIGEVRNFAEKNNVILVLKGERSLIAAPDGTVVINPTGNAGISRAGAGDTLTGIITTFLAQTFGREKPNLENTFETVAAALYVAGLAGDIAAEKFTERLMTASDVRDYLQEAIASITDYRLQITK
jgi:NAD(P)H-hydrate epimerase